MDSLRREFSDLFGDKKGYMNGGINETDVWLWVAERFTPKQKEDDNVAAVIDYLNLQTGKKFKATGAATKRYIKARYKEGNALLDFKKVIDIKCEAWLNDPKMSIYLRPETLFGTKMESYLNEGFTPAVDPLEELTRQITELFDSGNIPAEDREEMMKGGWPSKPWKDDMRAHELAKKIHLLKTNQEPNGG